MAKPTENLNWAENGTASDILEPTSAQRASGIAEGGSWTRKRMNWMFKAFGKWADWMKLYAMDSSENLNDVADKPTSRTNLEVLKAGTLGSEANTNTQNDARFLIESNNLSDLDSALAARGNLGSDNANNLTSGTVPEARLTTSTTTVKGITQLNDSVTSTSTTTAATASSAKDAYDRGTTGVNDASSAQSTANSAQSSANSAQSTANSAQSTANAALVDGTGSSQGRDNSQNDGRFLNKAGDTMTGVLATAGITSVTASGSSNFVAGESAGASITSSVNNVFVGKNTGLNTTTGDSNTASGYNSLYTNTAGYDNVSIGRDALRTNNSGWDNVAVGTEALYSNTNSGGNSAVGKGALYSNYGSSNCALGKGALYSNTSGFYNHAFGTDALYYNTSASSNCAFGRQALYYNTTGGSNCSFGSFSLYENTTGDSNTAIGKSTLRFNTTGYTNSAFGEDAGWVITTGHNNTCLGNEAGTSDSPYEITTASDRIVLGNNSVTNLYCKVDLTYPSDMRDKRKSSDYGLGLNFISLLNPIKYVWDMRSDYMTDDMESGVEVVRDGSHAKEEINLGVSAQEILEAERLCGVDADDQSLLDSSDENHLKLRGTRLVYPLINAVKELSAQNSELKKQLDNQEERLSKLEAK